MSLSLPAAPSLEQLRKQAKDLLRAHRAGDQDALSRIAAELPHLERALKLSDAQLVIARQHGFASWPRLRSYVARVQEHGPELQHPFRADIGYYQGRALGLCASAQDGTPGAVAAFERWDAPLTSAGGRSVVAREHGFGSWSALARHVASLKDGGEPFARSYRAVEDRDLDALREHVDRSPWLVTARGTNGNDLLAMATSMCDERLVALLLDRGADPARANAHGWTPLHQAAYAGQPVLVTMLLDAGAPVDVSARGDGGTPLIVALFWGHREAAELLAERGLCPPNLRVAAALGRPDLIDRLLDADGRLSPDAGAHRGFYRPHSGFPRWRPSDSRSEILGEALSWAARNDRADAVDALVTRGTDVDADVYRGTPLAWAAFRGRERSIRRLLALGADPNRRTTFGGPRHGEGITALHLAAQQGHLKAIEALLEGGADATLCDALFDSTPAGWAEEFGKAEAAELLVPPVG